MKFLVSAFTHYLRDLNKKTFLQVSVFVALLIILNYTVGIEKRISQLEHFPLRVLAFFLLYLLMLGFAYWSSLLYSGTRIFNRKIFSLLLLISPLVFAVKIAWQTTDLHLVHMGSVALDRYCQIILEWPLKSAFIFCFVAMAWKILRLERPIGALSVGTSFKPYFILLLAMVPLIAFACTQSDFLAVYPKLKKIHFLYSEYSRHWPFDLGFELAYGTDFFTIELFFRGFVVLAFAKFVGKEAILPMAAFYCSIHFGKPVFECISSFFGGLLLGVIVYETRSIFGGLIVHLGIAWLMELGGWLARQLSP